MENKLDKKNIRPLWYRILLWFLFNCLLSVIITFFLIAHDLSKFFDFIFQSFIFTQFVSFSCWGFVPWVGIRFSHLKTSVMVLLTSLATLIATNFGILMAMFVLNYIFPAFAIDSQPVKPDGISPLVSYSISFIIALIIALVMTYFFIINSRKMKAIKDLEEAKLQQLQERMNPHFLFNSLNTIHSLIHSNPKRAAKSVLHLAETYRFLLKHEKDALVSFDQEWFFLENYLKLTKIRFEKNLQFELTKRGDFSDVKIPPLTIQPIVENSIKHGQIQSGGKTTIHVQASIVDNAVVLRVEDNGVLLSDTEKSSGTLSNIRRRLQYYFPQSSFTLQKENNECIVAQLQWNITH